MIPIVLKVYDGGKLKTSRAFRAERIRLGSAAADLLLESPAIAPSHAVIESGAQGAVFARHQRGARLCLNGQPIIAAPLAPRRPDLHSASCASWWSCRGARGGQPTQLKTRPRLQLIQGEKGSLHRSHPPALSRAPGRAPRRAVAHRAPPATRDSTTSSRLPSRKSRWLLLRWRRGRLRFTPNARGAARLRGGGGPGTRAPTPVPGKPLPAGHAPGWGGECAEVELFWGDTRVSVWQLQPGEQFHAGTAPGCDALLQGISRAPVLRGDVNGWVIAAPRPLQLFLEEERPRPGRP